jgi:hypothetical protein
LLILVLSLSYQVQTFVKKGLPGAAFLLLHEVCPAGEDKTRVALSVAVHASLCAVQLQAAAVQQEPTNTSAQAAASAASRSDMICASAMLFLSLVGSDTSSFCKIINILKYWALTSSTASSGGRSSLSSRFTVSSHVLLSAILDRDVDAAQVVARWLSDAAIEDARDQHLTNVLQSSVWRHIVEWTQITGCFVCQRAIEQLIQAGDWGQLMCAACQCSIRPQILVSLTSSFAPDSVQKTYVTTHFTRF